MLGGFAGQLTQEAIEEIGIEYVGRVAELNLYCNHLGAEGGALVAAALKTNTTLTRLECAQLGRPSNQGD